MTVTAPNQAPTAAFTLHGAALAASFDGSGSSDADGTIASYAWDFGDGSTGTGMKPSHTYAAAGDYTVTLTVTDDGGATDAVTHQRECRGCQPGAQGGLHLVGEATWWRRSTGPVPRTRMARSPPTRGTSVTGATGTGAKPGHTYAAAGDYTVTLTVKDNPARRTRSPMW